MRVAMLGGGTIARLVLQHAERGDIPGVQLVAVAGRSASSRGAGLSREFGVPYVVGREALLAQRPDAVLEAASHDAVREHLVALLEAAGFAVEKTAYEKNRTVRELSLKSRAARANPSAAHAIVIQYFSN